MRGLKTIANPSLTKFCELVHFASYGDCWPLEDGVSKTVLQAVPLENLHRPLTVAPLVNSRSGEEKKKYIFECVISVHRQQYDGFRNDQVASLQNCLSVTCGDLKS